MSDGEEMKVDIYVKNGLTRSIVDESSFAPIPAEGFNPSLDLSPELAVAPDEKETLINVTADHLRLLKKSDTGFIGLMNQGATCYLNSLLQSLFMTPALTKALFDWTYEVKSHGPAEFCIPYQLSLLFARLALTKRSAVGTQDLTKSFRWNAAESFRQHDIQELMRVLFDALERTLKDPARPPITDIYQGFLGDYISCPACDYNREHQEKYLDVSVVIKGTNTVAEAIANYVTPEILSGDNMWRCSRCNHKVEARKGLRFYSLPDILTVQLKRFVYDPERRCRVKLNDRVTFEDHLDLTEHLYCEDPSKRKKHLYKLFAILMHSGTAMGGHYYAFIKSPLNKRWMEFNDAVVSYLEEDKLKAAYGGEQNGSSAYMLMYQRVYEDHEKPKEQEQEQKQVTEQEKLPNPFASLVPKNLAAVIEEEDKKWAEEMAALEKERRKVDISVIYNSQETRFRFDKDDMLRSVQEQVRQALGIAEKFSAECVRLRFFVAEIGIPEATFTGREDLTLEQCGFKRTNMLVLETRSPEEQFPEYNPNLIPIRIRSVTKQNLQAVIDESPSFAGPGVVAPKDITTVSVEKTATLRAIKEAYAQISSIPLEKQRLIRLDLHLAEVLHNDDASLQSLEFFVGQLLHCEIISDEEKAKELELADVPESKRKSMLNSISPLCSLFEQSRSQITIEFNHPDFVDPKDPKNYLFDRCVRINRFKSIAQLKELISPIIDIVPEEFRLRSSPIGVVFKDEDATVDSVKLTDGSIVFAERGKPLKKDEFDMKFYFFNPEKEKPFTVLFELPFSKSWKISELKKKLLAYLNEFRPNGKGGNTLNIQYMRLREKKKYQVGKIFLDNSSLGKSIPMISDGQEICIQRIDNEENITNLHKCIFVQRYHPHARILDRKSEIIIRTNDNVAALKDQLAIISSIPREHIGVAKGISTSEMRPEQAAKLNFRDPKIPDELLMSVMPIRVYDGDLIVFQDNEESPNSESKVPSTANGAAKVVRKAPKSFGSDAVKVARKPAAEPVLRIYTAEDIEVMELVARLEAEEAEKERQERKKKAEEEAKRKADVLAGQAAQAAGSTPLEPSSNTATANTPSSAPPS